MTRPGEAASVEGEGASVHEGVEDGGFVGMHRLGRDKDVQLDRRRAEGLPPPFTPATACYELLFLYDPFRCCCCMMKTSHLDHGI